MGSHVRRHPESRPPLGNGGRREEKYVHAKSTWSAAAALVDGVWTEGKASCFKSDPDWEINFMRDVIRPLPDHAIITAVDCHV